MLKSDTISYLYHNLEFPGTKRLWDTASSRTYSAPKSSLDWIEIFTGSERLGAKEFWSFYRKVEFCSGKGPDFLDHLGIKKASYEYRPFEADVYFLSQKQISKISGEILVDVYENAYSPLPHEGDAEVAYEPPPLDESEQDSYCDYCDPVSLALLATDLFSKAQQVANSIDEKKLAKLIREKLRSAVKRHARIIRRYTFDRSISLKRSDARRTCIYTFQIRTGISPPETASSWTKDPSIAGNARSVLEKYHVCRPTNARPLRGAPPGRRPRDRGEACRATDRYLACCRASVRLQKRG